MPRSSPHAAKPARPQPPQRLPWRVLAGGAGLLIIATLVAYVPALRAGYIWDDDWYVTHNPALRTTSGLIQIWTDIGTTVQYYPLVFTSFWFEYHLWGLSPAGYHLVNVLLHTLSALLVWRLLRRLSIPGAWLAAALFALHPVHVESVAWITERKNVLSGFFYLAAMLAYFRFCGLTDAEARAPRRWRFYALALVLFACALLSKTVTSTLPGALLLLLWLKRPRLAWRDIGPLIPLAALGLALGLLTAWVEKHRVGAEGPDWALTFPARCLIAGHALWFYVGKLVWPANLTFFYTRWSIDPTAWLQYLWPLAALALVVTLALLRKRIGKGPLVAALFFGGTLLPALGFVDVYPMRFSFVADHFQYLASLGPLTLLAALATTALARPQQRARRILGLTAVVAVLAMLGTLTWRQARVYHDVDTLWRDTLAKNPDAWLAQNNLGNDLAHAGAHDQAIAHFNEALRVRPRYADAYHNLANSLLALGQIDESIQQFNRALEIQPNHAQAHNGLGTALERQGQTAAAIAQYTAALQTQPAFAEAHNNLGLALVKQGDVRAALEHYRQAVQLRPELVAARTNLAEALLLQGDAAGALEQCTVAVALMPSAPEVHYALGSALAAAGRNEEADAQYGRAVALRPDVADAACKWGLLWARQGRPDLALPHLQRALAIREDFADAHNGLGGVLATQGNLPEAVRHFQRAVELRPDYVDARCNLGQALLGLGRREEGLAQYRAVLRLDPRDPRALRALGDGP